jgi:hypothetical protein
MPKPKKKGGAMVKEAYPNELYTIITGYCMKH